MINLQKLKNGPPYRQYCREDLKELILYACPLKRKSTLFDFNDYNPMRCNIYEEAREKRSYSLGAGERGEEFDEEASSMRFFTFFFGINLTLILRCESIWEECCDEGCVIGEIGEEECF